MLDKTSAYKAGLVKLNIKSNSGSGGLKTTAATKLATTTRTSVPGYGIQAQRSGMKSIFNAKAYNSLSHSMLRHDLNDNRLKWTNNLGGAFYTRMPDMGINKSNKFAEALTAIGALATLTGTVVNTVAAVKAASAADASGSVSKSASNNSSTGTTSLNDMKNADSSTELSAALTKAKADQAAIPGKLQSANSELSSLKGQTDNLKSASENADADYQKNLKDIETTGEKVNTQKQTAQACTDSYNSSKEAWQWAVADYNRIAKLPDTQKMPDGMVIDNTGKKAAAKAKMEEAERKMNEAETKMNEANAKLNKLNRQLNELKGKTEGLKQAAGDAKDAYDTNLKNIETKEKEVKQLEDDKKELDSEIPKQEKRLQELQKKEDSELDKVNKQVSGMQGDIDKLMSSINVNDENGLSKKEIRNKEKADAKQSELDRLKERQLELQKRKAIRNLPTENHNGIQFKSGYINGTVAYFVGGKEVSQTEYEAQLAQAKEANNS